MEELQWERLVEEYYDSVYRFCYHMCKTTEEAEDATQQTFLKVFRRGGKLLTIQNQKAYIYQVARNTCLDRLRRIRTLVFDNRASEHQQDMPKISMIGKQLKQHIDRLPRRQKEVFILRHLHEFTTSETSQFLGIGEGSVKVHLKRALNSLRNKLLEPHAQ